LPGRSGRYLRDTQSKKLRGEDYNSISFVNPNNITYSQSSISYKISGKDGNKVPLGDIFNIILNKLWKKQREALIIIYL
jgi:hypothetical protein